MSERIRPGSARINVTADQGVDPGGLADAGHPFDQHGVKLAYEGVLR